MNNDLFEATLASHDKQIQAYVMSAKFNKIQMLNQHLMLTKLNTKTAFITNQIVIHSCIALKNETNRWQCNTSLQKKRLPHQNKAEEDDEKEEFEETSHIKMNNKESITRRWKIITEVRSCDTCTVEEFCYFIKYQSQIELDPGTRGYIQ